MNPQTTLISRIVKPAWGRLEVVHDSIHLRHIRILETYFSMDSPMNLLEEIESIVGALRPLAVGTPFQIQVWQALCRIPCGAVSTYRQVAEQIGRRNATRAVGTAIGANPLAVLIPCHRVLRADGGLGGYRWGVEAKRALLAAESICLSE